MGGYYMIRGTEHNVILPPLLDRNVSSLESILPVHEYLMNGRITDTGKWARRSGYAPKWVLPDAEPVVALIPEKSGYAVTQSQHVYRLGSTPTKLDGALGGSSHVSWANASGTIILCNGGIPKVLLDTEVNDLDGAPPSALWVDTLDSYTILSGFDDFSFRWSAPGTTTSWPEANINNVLKEGDPIVFMKVANRELYFFKKYSVEVWVNVGGLTVFARRAMVNLLDATTHHGEGIARNSVVLANGAFYFSIDRQIYRMNNLQAQLISQPIRHALEALHHPERLTAFDLRQEHCLMFVEPIEGRCFVYDYLHDAWSEDARWHNGAWERLPLHAYMELDGVAYMGGYDYTGTVYTWARGLSTDDGTPIRTYRKFTALFSTDGSTRRFNHLRLRMQRGNANDASVAHVQLRYAIDRHHDMQTENISMGAVGEYHPYQDIYNLGIGKEITFELAETDADESLVTHAWVTAEPLGA